MKNDDLDALTEKALQVFKSIPEMTLHGSGEFLSVGGTPIPKSTLLESLYRARKNAGEVHDALRNEPRITRAKRGEDNGGEEGE